MNARSCVLIAHLQQLIRCVRVSGIWIHGCIDGYSRYLVYLEARLDKESETVRSIFVQKCEEHGWPSRLRGDRGKVRQRVKCSLAVIMRTMG